MTLGRNTLSTGRRSGSRPVLVVLLATALIPTICVLWFMNAAMQNERLAVRQKLTDVYRQKLATDQEEIAAFLSDRLRLPPAIDRNEDTMRVWGLMLFARIVHEGKADSAILLDDVGQPAYPQPPAAVDDDEAGSPTWREAQQMEFEQADYGQALSLYAKVIEERPADVSLRAQAVLARGRCLIRLGRLDDALQLLLCDLSASLDLQFACDPFGRDIFLDGQMLALQSLPRDDARYGPLAHLLAKEVSNYGGDPVTLAEPIPGVDLPIARRFYAEARMPAPQRLLFMETLDALGLDGVAFSTLEAEQLAQRYLSQADATPTPMRITPSGAPRLWHAASADGHAIYLFDENSLIADLSNACKLNELVGVKTLLELPGRIATGSEPFLAVDASERLPGWRLALYLDEDPFAASARKAEAAYLTAGVSAVVVIALLAAALASYLNRQIRLTRLKNDLIATVSHELKTPLASMRVLVDTMREGRCANAKQADEYLELIARENERLCRLIDNFLTFSRMERNKRAFEFEPVDVAEALRTAAEGVRDRFVGPEATLEMEVPDGLPRVMADRDALVTVILNLLDNAWKYSNTHKRVQARVYTENGWVCVDVRDNGVGMSRRAARRVFDKFYQVDRTLSRKAGGCGLGLSIVKFILDAHGGTIGVRSQIGKGSAFTVRLPAIDASASKQEKH